MATLEWITVGSLAALAGSLLAKRTHREQSGGWRVPLDADLTDLENRDPLLAAMLEAATVPGPAQRSVLSLQPWEGGSLRCAAGRFRHRGMFFEPRDGTVGFVFVLENCEDESSVTYAGALSSGGRRITYSTLRRTTRSAPGERMEWVWEAGR